MKQNPSTPQMSGKPSRCFSWVCWLFFGVLIAIGIILLLVPLIAGNFLLKSFTELERIRDTATESDIRSLFPSKQFLWNEFARSDGGKIIIIFGSRRGRQIEILKLKAERQVFSSCRTVPYTYAALVVSIDPQGRLDGYSWDGEGPSYGTCPNDRGIP